MGTFHGSSELGSLGEELGCRYLKDKGYRILETNYCNETGRRLGEIDIIAEKSRELVFLEVKSRLKRGEEMISPEMNITPHKLRKLDRIAKHYMREKRCMERSYHFDALTVIYDPGEKKASIRHLEHIFF
jgi:putative endonuclease